jgi:hypothetical protein
MTEDLDHELAALAERTTKLDETSDLPRGKLPALFRAARAEKDAAKLALVGTKLGERLADRALLEPIVELARDVEAVRAPLLAALEARAAAPDAWAVEKQAKLLAPRTLETVEELTRESPPCSLPRETLLALVETRLASSRRDRVSLEVTLGALRLLAKERTPEVAALAARVVEAETRRAGKEDPELALAALDLLQGAEPAALLRIARRLEKRVDRKKVQELLAAIGDAAMTALGASKEDAFDLLAEDLGLDATGALRIPLEEGEAVLTIDRTGTARTTSAKPLAQDDKREVEAAVAQLTRARRDHKERLERALGSGRTWPLEIFRASWLANPLLRELASRLVWIALPDRIAFRPSGERLEDVFGGPVAGLAAKTLVRLAHPVELDPDELALWRERLPEIGRQPFPQLHRPVMKEKEPLDRFVGRELYQEDAAELGKKRGYRGLPLRGDGPWELARELPGHAAVLAITLDRVAGQVIVPKRKDALRVFDDPEAKPRERRDAAPRAKIASVQLVGDSEVAKAEAALDLHLLTDPIEAGTDVGFGDWQKKKFKDPAKAWREAQLLMMRGSEAAVLVRAALIRAFEPGVKIEGRLVVLGGENGLYYDLGANQAFEGQLRDWVPPWKLEGRFQAPDLDWPFEPAEDPETVRAVTAVVSLARVVKSPPP